MYGLPKTATELYQVIKCTWMFRYSLNILFYLLYSCLGMLTLLYSDRRVKKKGVNDTTLLRLVVVTENCRRMFIGGMEETNCVRMMEQCCDVCSPQANKSCDRKGDM